MHISFLKAALLGSIVPGMAVASSLGDVRPVGNTTYIDTPDGTVVVQVLSDDIFRVSNLPTPDTKLPQSQSAVMAPVSVKTFSFLTDSIVSISTSSTSVIIDRLTGKVNFLSPSGDLLLAEAEGVINNADVKSVSFLTDEDENFYGAGERAHSFRLNGDSLPMYNRPTYGYGEGDPRINQMNITMPMFISDVGYGVLFDDYNTASLQFGDTVRYTSETTKPLSYYFINGGSVGGAVSNYSRLTGRQSLPPFWTLGYITSKYGYRTQDETLGVIDTLKTNGYPVDGVVLDLYWYGSETDMGRFDWMKSQWPQPQKMLSDLRDKGVNVVLINQPYINKKGAIDNYNFLKEKGLLAKDAEGNTHDVHTWVGDAGMLDVSNPDTRQWIWQQLKRLTDQGVAGWWGDLGEPEVHPETIVHENGETASQYHNVYGNVWASTIYNGLRKDFPEMRPMLMMRGGTSGLQRYSVFPWSGDVGRSWEGLQPQIKIMLNSGLSGLGYMSSDIGGFAVDPKKPATPELYLRWLQLGTFTPMLRTHAQVTPEPYHFPEVEKYSKRFIKMRYEWLPYNYTLAYQNASEGLPLVRPLNINGDNPDSRYANISDEYLWGDEVLVAPVMKNGVRSRKVLFPAGTWINFNNPKQVYKGGTTVSVAAPLSQLPIFVRQGAFLPQYMEPIENTSQYNPQFLTVKYYPSSEQTSYTLFDDDRKSPTSLEDGAYLLTTFTGEKKKGEISIEISTNGGSYEGMPAVRMLTMEIVNTPRPKSVTLGNQQLDAEESLKLIRQYGWYYDSATSSLFVRFPYSGHSESLSIR